MALMILLSILIEKETGFNSMSSSGVDLNASIPLLKHLVPFESVKFKMDVFKTGLFKSY